MRLGSIWRLLRQIHSCSCRRDLYRAPLLAEVVCYMLCNTDHLASVTSRHKFGLRRRESYRRLEFGFCPIVSGVFSCKLPNPNPHMHGVVKCHDAGAVPNVVVVHGGMWHIVGLGAPADPYME
ncbi:hypothetical protein ACHAW6_011308 [Cyclotella cf. meneghiniana]